MIATSAPRLLAVGLLLLASLRGGVARAQLPPVPPDTGLLRSARIDSLPSAQRTAWRAYLADSRRRYAADRDSMIRELRALGRDSIVSAVEGPNQVLVPRMTDAWFGSEEARRMAENILSFQTPSGGWSKRLELGKAPRQPGQNYGVEGWAYIGTFDNDATTDHMRFLARADAARRDGRYEAAFLKGLDYTLEAQYPNGCWPQVYPLQGWYHDAATMNDDMMVHVLTLLRDVERGEFGFVAAQERRRAGVAVGRGVDCILASQVVVNGKRTVWGAQSDPLTLRPVKARSYEHPSLSGGESVGIMEFLMSIEIPTLDVVGAVYDAADWFRAAAIPDHEMVNRNLRERPGAGPIWARFYEIGTNRPIFSNRDGVILYDWSKLQDERKYGYSWYGTAPARALAEFDVWRLRHPPLWAHAD
jgi:PelA/Pel-15E family pectate lyase